MSNSVSPNPVPGAVRMRLYDRAGQRKYLTPAERIVFLQATLQSPSTVRTFCETLAYTGCRISEALALTTRCVDLADGVLVFESLKKRRRGVYRAVPVPPEFLATLIAVHDLQKEHPASPLWSWSRTTAWRRVGEVMAAANIEGGYATPKGLRHGFGIKAVTSEVPLNMTQKWMGHARLATTSIYTDAVGPEERKIAERMWT